MHGNVHVCMYTCACVCTYDHMNSLWFQDFHRRVVPKAGLDKIIVSDELRSSLEEIIQFEKARYGMLVHTYVCTYN